MNDAVVLCKPFIRSNGLFTIGLQISMIPPRFAADSSSYHKGNGDSGTKDGADDLPTISEGSLLLGGGLLLNELAFNFLTTFFFLGGVPEQSVSLWAGDEKRCGHEHDADEGFHMNVPFLLVGTKNPAPFESRTLMLGLGSEEESKT